jgi:hypothetical protein
MHRVLLFLFALAGIAFADEPPRSEGTSASGKIAWHVVEKTNPDQGAEVFISEGDQDESAGQKLCDVPWARNTRVFVSPDDFWIIVESGGASMGVSLNVLQREKGLVYHEMPKKDVALAVLTNAFRGDAAAAENMDHVYTVLLGWSADSKCILVRVSGNKRGRDINPVFAIYDLGKGSVGFDLAKFNGRSSGG